MSPSFNGAHLVKGTNFESLNVGPLKFLEATNLFLLKIVCFLVCCFDYNCQFLAADLDIPFFRLVPAGQTEFSKDAAFGYKASNLREVCLIPQDINLEQCSLM